MESIIARFCGILRGIALPRHCEKLKPCENPLSSRHYEKIRRLGVAIYIFAVIAKHFEKMLWQSIFVDFIESLESLCDSVKYLRGFCRFCGFINIYGFYGFANVGELLL